MPDQADRERFFLDAGQYTSAMLGEHDGLYTFVFTTDPWVSRLTFVQGHFGADRMAAVVDFVTEMFDRSPIAGRAFVDVGANIGTSTLYALHRFGAAEAVAIEPHPGNLRLLRANLAMNDYTGRVRVVPAAASDTAGEALLDVAETNQGDHRLVPLGVQPPSPDDDHPGDYLTVRAAQLDRLVPAWIDVGLVWVDAQGHDARVLAGAERLCAMADACVIEYWPYGIERTDGLDEFHRAVSDRWPLFVDVEDIFDGSPSLRPTSALSELSARYPPDGSHTELLLLRDRLPARSWRHVPPIAASRWRRRATNALRRTLSH